MREFKKVEGKWIVEETTSVFGLTIAPGAEITAPEGKTLTMVFNGVAMDPVPGCYEGDIVLVVADAIPVNNYAFKAGVCIENGKVVESKSVLPAVKGEFGDGWAKNVEIVARNNNFDGIYVSEDGEYTIDGVKIDFEGNGDNDFIGYGAAVCAYGSGKITVNNADIKVRGSARNSFFAGGNCTLVVNDSKFENFDGALQPTYEDNVMPGNMRRVPWMLGLRGNNRASNLADYANAYYNNCELRSYGWGVMSTDGVRVCRLNMKDCLIEVTGPSGYGAFSIGDCIDTFDNCTVNTNDYALIVANETASGEFKNGTVINSGRFGCMFFRNEGGFMKVNSGSVVNTEKATFLVKGCAPTIEVDGAELNTKNGVILQLINTDDPGNPAGYYMDPKEEDKYVEGRDLYSAKKGDDVLAVFKNVTLKGSIYNGTTEVEGDTGPKMSMGPPPGADFPGGAPGGMPGGPGGMPGGPGGMPGGPGGGPGGPGGAPSEPKSVAKNLSVTLENATLEGDITACKSLHRVEKVFKDNCEELGEVDNVPGPVINNGVIVSVGEGAVWTVADVSYLSALEISAGGKVVASEMTVDGVATAIAPGSYKGKIVLKK